jgi:hypothetical protein
MWFTLVDGDHLLVGQDAVRLLRHVPHVAADDERRLHTDGRTLDDDFKSAGSISELQKQSILFLRKEKAEYL